MKKHNILFTVLSLLLVVTVVAGVFLVPRMMPRDEVAVYPVMMVGYTDYYSGSSESYGIVTTDKVQTLYVSGTQTVTEIMVYPGQTVQEGDLLYSYDTTLSDLAVERKTLANQQLEMELKTAQSELATLKKMKPIVYKPGSSNSSSTKTDYTKSPADKNLLNTVYSTKTTGKTAASPLYFWLQTNTQVDDALIDGLFAYAASQSDGVSPEFLYVVFQMSSGNRTNTEFAVHSGIKITKVYESVPIAPTEPPVTTEPTEPTEATEPSETTEPTEATEPSETTEPTEATEPSETTEPTEATEPSETTEPTEETEPADSGSSGSTSQSTTISYSFTFFTPPSAPSEDSGTIEWNDGYTAAELTSMKKEKEAQIKQLQFEIKMGKAELNIMKKEASDGKVLAEFTGVVGEILDPAMAMATGDPLMKVTGGGGYYVEGTISELALDTIELGQTVTVNSWDTGAVYTGTIVEVGAYPVAEQQYYGPSNVSYYPYRVFIDESADLQEGYYVSMTYQSAEAAAGTLYIQNAFLRSEGSRTYVLVRNAEGLLEKRYLNCGVSTDGYMTPVYAGITEEDYLAFPYGSHVTEGAPTYEGTDQDLYGY